MRAWENRTRVSRIIGHLDLDYFYAQVEELEDPSLKGRPVLVCVYSGRTEESGVVSTANYKAREHGVRSGMPIALAKRRLEALDAAYIPMNHGKYEVYSDRVMETLRSEVDVVEQTGIDEAFFEATERANRDFQRASALAKEIKSRIFREERLTCSIGVGPNKVVAKIASDFKKPDGLTIVNPEETVRFLSPLPVSKIYGVGPKTAKILEEDGVKSIGELRSVPVERLSDILGTRLAAYLHGAADGTDDEPVADRAGAAQLSRIITLKQDTGEPDRVLSELLPALKDLHAKLESKNLFFRNVSAIGILRDLSIHSKSRTLDAPTNDYLFLEREVRQLFTALLLEAGELRRAGVRVSDLQSMVDQSSLTEFTG